MNPSEAFQWRAVHWQYEPQHVGDLGIRVGLGTFPQPTHCRVANPGLGHVDQNARYSRIIKEALRDDSITHFCGENVELIVLSPVRCTIRG